MRHLHIANTFFEKELESTLPAQLQSALRSHPIVLQLQFLPLLYASSQEGFLISDPPTPGTWKTGTPLATLLCLPRPDLSSYTEIESWGPSLLIAEWAHQQGLRYTIPKWEIVKTVNSKTFSFTHSPKLPHATLFTQTQSVYQWIQSFPGPKVLKTSFGVSGRGHFFIDDRTSLKQLDQFLRKEFDQQRAVIGEPWVKRLLDFSTQWKISSSKEIIFLGATLCKNTEHGQYQSNTVGPLHSLFGAFHPFVQQQKEIALPLLQTIASLPFFGHIGIDAMIYQYNDPTPILHPIVEINGRKTMGWTALAFQQRHAPDATLTFSYLPTLQGRLPSAITLNQNNTLHFRRNIHIEMLP